MMIVKLMTAFLLALCMTAPTLSAQRIEQIAFGTEVRVTTRAGLRVDGVIASLDRDTLRIETRLRTSFDRPIVSLARADVATYSFNAGHDRGGGAIRGALIGAGLGAGLVAFAYRSDKQSHADLIISGTMVAVPVALILTGLGAAIGAAAAPQRWSDQLVMN